MSAGTDASGLTSLGLPLGPDLTAEQAREIFQQGEAAVVFALLSQAKMLAELQKTTTEAPSTPSAMIPVYTKPTTNGRRQKPGRKNGHVGSRRPPPPRIDRRQTHTLETCPRCQGPVTRCKRVRTRLIEDIPENITPVVAEHTIPTYWCRRCHETVEPTVPEALPNSSVGLRTLVLSAWLHYALGNTLSQIVEVFNFHLQFKLTPGGLTQMWARLQEILFAWYLEIQSQALDAAVLHADETGWRVQGKTWWLWCFTTTDLTYYLIDRCRGSPVLKKFFRKQFAGVLVSDFWGAYTRLACAQQKCLPHLLRELKKVDHYHRAGGDWPAFAKQLRRLLRDAIRLRKRSATPAEEFPSRRQRLDDRLQSVIATPWENAHARRLIKRLRRHAAELFTFLDHPEVPFDNNHAERMIRPAVIIRKNSYANASEAGADVQAVLMSVYRTLKQRGHHPIQTIVEAVRTYLKTGQLPPLPSKVTGDG